MRDVQVTPSGLVITRLPDPVVLTATKSPFPYVTLDQLLSDAEVREVHLLPVAFASAIDCVVILIEEAEGVDVPAELVAVTVNV